MLDGVVVLFDAVAGVEPQSETVWRQADRCIPSHLHTAARGKTGFIWELRGSLVCLRRCMIVHDQIW